MEPSGSYWQSYIGTSDDTLDLYDYTTVRRALSKIDPPVESVLDADDLCQELKAKDFRLLQYLSTPRNIKHLISIATTLPPEGASRARMYKYPFIATEVLRSDTPTIIMTLMAHEDLLDTLWHFLSDPPDDDQFSLSQVASADSNVNVEDQSGFTSAVEGLSSSVNSDSSPDHSDSENLNGKSDALSPCKDLATGTQGHQPSDYPETSEEQLDLLDHLSLRACINSPPSDVSTLPLNLVTSGIHGFGSDLNGSRPGEPNLDSQLPRNMNCEGAEESVTESDAAAVPPETKDSATIVSYSSLLDEFEESTSLLQCKRLCPASNLQSADGDNVPDCNTTSSFKPSFRLKTSRSSRSIVSLSYVDDTSQDSAGVELSREPKNHHYLCPSYENTVLCGYFSQIVSAIYARAGDQLAAYLKSRPHLLLKLLRLLDSPSIAEIVKLFLLAKSPEQAVFAPNRIVFILLSQLLPTGPLRLYDDEDQKSSQFLKRVESLDEELGELQENISLILIELMETECLFHPIYLATLTSKTACSFLMKCLSSNNQAILSSAVEILSSLCYTATAFQEQLHEPSSPTTGSCLVSSFVKEREPVFDDEAGVVQLDSSNLSDYSVDLDPFRADGRYHHTHNEEDIGLELDVVRNSTAVTDTGISKKFVDVLGESVVPTSDPELEGEGLSSPLVDDHLLRIPLHPHHSPTLEHEQESLEHLKESLIITRARSANSESPTAFSDKTDSIHEWCGTPREFDLDGNFNSSTHIEEGSIHTTLGDNISDTAEKDMFSCCVRFGHILFNESENFILPTSKDLEKIARGVFIDEFIVRHSNDLRILIENSSEELIARHKRKSHRNRKAERTRAGSLNFVKNGNMNREHEVDISVDADRTSIRDGDEFHDIVSVELSNEEYGEHSIQEKELMKDSEGIDKDAEPELISESKETSCDKVSSDGVKSVEVRDSLKLLVPFTSGTILEGQKKDDDLESLCDSSLSQTETTIATLVNASEKQPDTNPDTEGEVPKSISIDISQNTTIDVLGDDDDDDDSLADGFNPHSIFVDREGASSGRSTFDSINNSLSSSSSSSSCVQSSDSSRRPSYTVTKASLDPTGIDDTGHNDNLLPKKSHSPRGIHPIVGFSCLRILNLVKALQRTTQQIYCLFNAEFLTTLVLLLFSHKWNSSLHISITEILQSIVTLEGAKVRNVPPSFSFIDDSTQSYEVSKNVLREISTTSINDTTTTEVSSTNNNDIDNKSFHDPSENVLRILLTETPFLYELIRYFKKIRRVRLESSLYHFGKNDVVSCRREKRRKLLTGQTAHVMHLGFLLRNGQSSFPQDINDCLMSHDEWTFIVLKEVAAHTAALAEPLGGGIPMSMKIMITERQKYILPLGLGGRNSKETFQYTASENLGLLEAAPMSQPSAMVMLQTIGKPEGPHQVVNEQQLPRSQRHHKKQKGKRGKRVISIEGKLPFSSDHASTAIRLCKSAFSLDELADPFEEDSYDDLVGDGTHRDMVQKRRDYDRNHLDGFGHDDNHLNYFSASSTNGISHFKARRIKEKTKQQETMMRNHFLFGESYESTEDVQNDWARFDRGEEIPLDRSDDLSHFGIAPDPSDFSLMAQSETPFEFGTLKIDEAVQERNPCDINHGLFEETEQLPQPLQRATSQGLGSNNHCQPCPTNIAHETYQGPGSGETSYLESIGGSPCKVDINVDSHEDFNVVCRNNNKNDERAPNIDRGPKEEQSPPTSSEPCSVFSIQPLMEFLAGDTMNQAINLDHERSKL